jgi:hypothetical protein
VKGTIPSFCLKNVENIIEMIGQPKGMLFCK